MMRTAPQRLSRSIRLYLLGTLVAVELLMSFSFLGYFHIEPISITIAYIPVLLAGALLGPFEAIILGTVFGLASMWKASAGYVMTFDQLFSPIMSGHPLESILLSVGSRALFGLIIGVLYSAARRTRHPAVWIGIISFLGQQIHAALVYCAMWLFFPETGFTPIDSIRSLATLNGVLTSLVTTGLVLLIWLVLQSRSWQQFLNRIEAAQRFRPGVRYHIVSLVCMIVVALVSSIAVAIYFVDRMEMVLDQQGTILTAGEHADLIHLQIQFLVGVLSLMALVIVFLIFNRLYNTYMDREAKLDALTGVLNRRAFFQSCTKALRTLSPQEGADGYFIMVDMDRFKQINDQEGHPEGDRVLKEAAMELEAAFSRNGFVGRVGGDEFAVMIYLPITRDELERSLQRFQTRLHQIRWSGHPMTCSIGAQPATAAGGAEALYQAADNLLYLAKARGRDQYVIGPAGETHAAEVTDEQQLEIQLN